MKRVTSVIKLKAGMKEEYKRRHDNIWPELSNLITRQGIRNYTIWYYEDVLFAYYETDDEGIKIQNAPEDLEVSAKWKEYMADIIEFVIDPKTEAPINLECMFLHE